MVDIIKANGEKQAFSEEKLRHSIHRAGIPKDLEEKVVAHIHTKLHEGMHTADIYKHIVEFLDTANASHQRAKYSLKQAIMQLGPTGYPFEKFVARILDSEGFSTTTDVIVKGRCVSHEVDVVATKGNEKVMVEAKFHNSTGITTDLHVSLYTRARFEDVQDSEKFTKAMLVTNTKITTDALTYAQCVGTDVLGWSYPDNASLRDLVEKYHLHPITSLTQLSQMQKQQLLEQEIVLCQDLSTHPEALTQLNLPKDKQESVLLEAKSLCNTLQEKEN
ncbi:MAG TPA: restriction endonuclease [Patescibacteria group bacterium]|nr:restriction endonuclease [Patescibacteria group bacterium]